MRIFADNVEHYILALAISIGKDPASLETWRCVHIESHNISPAPSRFTDKLILTALKEHYKDVVCDVIICHDEDVLIIGKAKDLHIIEEIKTTLIGNCEANEKPDVEIYDLFSGWRNIRKVLLSKVTAGQTVATLEEKADFGDTASLQDVFHAAQQLKKARNPLHMMLVEDDELTSRMVSNLFKEQYAVITAKNAQEAIVNYLLHAPDMVFLDINLPDHNGFQVLKQILSDDPDAYVVMFSGNSYLDNITRALNAGASGFVAKPFSKDKMRRYIEDCAMANGKEC